MLTSDFDYNLPAEFITQKPAEPRDSSRLMVVDKKAKTVQHRHFFDIEKYLQPGDLVVWNNSKVFRARLRGTVELNRKAVVIPAKAGILSVNDKDSRFHGNDSVVLNAAPVEIFLVRPMENLGVWKVLAKPGKKLRLGMKVRFADDFFCEIMLKEDDGTILAQFPEDDAGVRAKANKYGEVPTPPYVKVNEPVGGLSEKYQTVYAESEGSVAAPTAGFHFTPELIEKLRAKGVQFAEVTLHVGLGTFLPVKSKNVEEHKMHSEWVELTAKNADLINTAKAEGRRVVAVGTTTVRTLEGICHSERSAAPAFGWEESPEIRGMFRGVYPVLRYGAQHDNGQLLHPYTGDINLFILPGFDFQIVDALITNFHLPKSTLLMLVSAFMGDRKFTLKCYEEAIKEKYRFYSFGDAMLIK